MLQGCRRWSVLLLAGWAFAGLACPLRVLTEELPPYQVVKNQQVVGGFAFLQVQSILRQAGWSCRTEVLPWASALALAQQPNVLIFSMARLPPREPLYHWLTPLLRADYHFYSAQRQVVQQLSQGVAPQQYMAVAVAGSMMDQRLQQLGFVPAKNLLQVRDVNEQWKMLQQNRAQLTLAFEPDFAALADPQVRQTRFYRSAQSMLQIELYLAASLQTDPVLLTRLRQAIAALQRATPAKPVR
jgi:polar amino acid transport system substrate-binding protein